MKLVAISDTHGQHQHLRIPESDLLIHAGDCTRRGTEAQIQEFCEWFSQQPAREKVFIAGNHDFLFQENAERARAVVRRFPIHYLEDSGAELLGLKIWGSPWQPWFFDWAFNLKSKQERAAKWALMPDQLDVLITHGPPYGILDRTSRGESVGCEALLERLNQIEVRAHLFGHIHEAAGTWIKDGRVYANACSLDHSYHPKNQPLELEL